MNGERFSRQRDLVPPERLSACRTTVVGVGAIGRQVALQLAAMGTRWIQLVDHDLVEPANLAAQGYLEQDLGRTKVQATACLCRQLDSEIQLVEVCSRFRRSMEVGNVLFCCVDRISVRRLIWEAVKDRVLFFADGRMSAEVLRVLASGDVGGKAYYPTTLFAPEQAYVGSCTAKSTIYCANIAAGLMLTQFTKWLRCLPLEVDQSLNLLAGELSAATP